MRSFRAGTAYSFRSFGICLYADRQSNQMCFPTNDSIHSFNIWDCSSYSCVQSIQLNNRTSRATWNRNIQIPVQLVNSHRGMGQSIAHAIASAADETSKPLPASSVAGAAPSAPRFSHRRGGCATDDGSCVPREAGAGEYQDAQDQEEASIDRDLHTSII